MALPLLSPCCIYFGVPLFLSIFPLLSVLWNVFRPRATTNLNKLLFWCAPLESYVWCLLVWMKTRPPHVISVPGVENVGLVSLSPASATHTHRHTLAHLHTLFLSVYFQLLTLLHLPLADWLISGPLLSLRYAMRLFASFADDGFFFWYAKQMGLPFSLPCPEPPHRQQLVVFIWSLLLCQELLRLFSPVNNWLMFEGYFLPSLPISRMPGF